MLVGVGLGICGGVGGVGVGQLDEIEKEAEEGRGV